MGIPHRKNKGRHRERMLQEPFAGKTVCFGYEVRPAEHGGHWILTKEIWP